MLKHELLLLHYIFRLKDCHAPKNVFLPLLSERYATEPKSNSKLTQREAAKAAYLMRSFGRKTMDIKRHTVYNKIEGALFQ